jgi:hypothetical protein
MTRLPDWRRRLADYVAAARSRPFAYGSHDCALFAAGAVAAMTRENPRLTLRYTTLKEGLRALRAEGYADHVALARALFPEIPVADARHGDLAVVETEGRFSLAVVGGSFVLAAAEPAGLGVVPLLPKHAGGHVCTAFRV